MSKICDEKFIELTRNSQPIEMFQTHESGVNCILGITMKRTALLLTSTALVSLSTAAHAYQDDQAEDVIIVEGQRGVLANSIAQQRADDGIVSVLSSDDIGQLPDENVAEAARRALGVSIANDQGEGRFVSVRGINSQLNSTSVNGVRLTSPEATDRRVALDVIDSDILESVTIRKTLSADMDADAIGASIELKTISGLDRKKPLRRVKIGTIYTEATEDFGPKVSGTYADAVMDGRLGVALNGSFQSREFASDNKEVDGGWETENFISPAEELEFRNYDIERERLSLAANFDYQFTDTTEIYLHTLYNDFSDQEFRSRVEVKVEDAVEDGVVVNNGGIVTFSGEDIEIDRDIKDRLEEQRVYSFVTGFKHQSDVWETDASIAFTHAEEEEPGRLDVNFDADISEAVSLDISNLMLPRLALSDTALATYLDANAFEADKFETTDGISEDEELAFTINLKRNVTFGENPGFVKTGLKYRLRDKSYDLDFEEYSYEGSGDTLATLGTTVDYSLDTFGPAPSPFLVRDFFNANVNNPAVLERDPDVALEEATLANFEASEDILAGYIMAQTDIDNWRLTGGIRVEHTEFEADTALFNEDDPTNPVPQATSDDYTDVLPSISLKYAYTENVNIRASYYASIVRPNFAQVLPVGAFNEDNELEAGNPDLERTKSNNFDLLAEYFPTDSSVIQGGFFYKDISDLITSTFSDVPGIYNGTVAYDEIESFGNVDEATIWGIEIGAHHAFENGFIVGANYTYADSEADIDGKTFPVPGQSEHVANLILGYDKGRFDLRAALSYKGENLDDVDTDLIGEGRWVLDQTFLDLSAKFDVNERIKLYADLKNALDTELEVSSRIDGVDYLNQYDEYGLQGQFGVIAKF